MKMKIVAKGYGQGIGHFSRFEGDVEVRDLKRICRKGRWWWQRRSVREIKL